MVSICLVTTSEDLSGFDMNNWLITVGISALHNGSCRDS